jgi:anthranilate synthase component 2
MEVIQLQPTLLMIDNYDSFTYNLVQMFRQYDLGIAVYRSDKITLEDVALMEPDYIVVSPGPKDPAHAGISVPLIKRFYQRIPILGVCLGMQCINEAFGGWTARAPKPMHGKTSHIYHENQSLFKGMPCPFKGARYHSLAVKFKESALTITARTTDGVIMGLSHPEYALHGVQFHPESFLTEHGTQMIENFLKLGPLKSDSTYGYDARPIGQDHGYSYGTHFA